MPLYKIPLWERYTYVDSDARFLFLCKAKCLHIDQVGLFVYYTDEKHLDPDFIRKHLIFRKRTHCIIEADNPEKAITTFFNEWEGAMIGGDCDECKALWINKEEEIIELPHCDLMRRNSQDEFICGEPMESGNGEFGMCVLEGYDGFEECPVAHFYHVLYEKEEKRKDVIKLQTKDGYKVVMADSILLD